LRFGGKGREREITQLYTAEMARISKTGNIDGLLPL